MGLRTTASEIGRPWLWGPLSAALARSLFELHAARQQALGEEAGAASRLPGEVSLDGEVTARRGPIGQSRPFTSEHSARWRIPIDSALFGPS
jgi:hypothetical protein